MRWALLQVEMWCGGVRSWCGVIGCSVLEMVWWCQVWCCRLWCGEIRSEYVVGCGLMFCCGVVGVVWRCQVMVFVCRLWSDVWLWCSGVRSRYMVLWVVV